MTALMRMLFEVHFQPMVLMQRPSGWHVVTQIEILLIAPIRIIVLHILVVIAVLLQVAAAGDRRGSQT